MAQRGGAGGWRGHHVCTGGRRHPAPRGGGAAVSGGEAEERVRDRGGAVRPGRRRAPRRNANDGLTCGQSVIARICRKVISAPAPTSPPGARWASTPPCQTGRRW